MVLCFVCVFTMQDEEPAKRMRFEPHFLPQQVYDGLHYSPIPVCFVLAVHYSSSCSVGK
jgi:hypothetical protein